MSYGNIRRSNVRQQLVPLDAVRAVVQEMTQQKIPVQKPVEADGGAYRAYCFNIANKHK